MSAQRSRGFSLIELMVVIVVIAILVGLALPSYRVWMANTRVRGAAESIQNGLRVARNEAAQRGLNVRFELTGTDATWQVCALKDNSKTSCGTFGTDSTLVEAHAAADTVGVVVGGSTSASTLTTYGTAVTGGLPGGITFTALARPDTATYGQSALLRIDTSSTAGNRRLVTTISAGGSVQMCDPGLPKSTAANGCT